MRSFTNVMPANTAMSCQWADILLLWDVIKAVLLRDPSLLFMSFNQSANRSRKWRFMTRRKKQLFARALMESHYELFMGLLYSTVHL